MPTREREDRVGIWRFQDNQKATAPVELKLPNEPVLGRHKKRVPSMTFHPTQPCGEDQKLCLWDLSAAAPALIWEQEPDKARDIKTHSTAIHEIALNADGSMLDSGGGDYLVKLWKTMDLAQGDVVGAAYQPHVVKPFQTMAGHSDSVFVNFAKEELQTAIVAGCSILAEQLLRVFQQPRCKSPPPVCRINRQEFDHSTIWPSKIVRNTSTNNRALHLQHHHMEIAFAIPALGLQA